MALATISGVALAPGVSRNRRLYTPEVIAKAAARMQERLADPNGLPIVMRTHHDAGDDSERIVGRVTEVTVDKNQALRYKANLYDTFHAREIANLVTPDEPALRSVSIHGYWMGTPKQVQTDEGLVTTADDLDIDAIDFTASPGVGAALIDSGSTKATESGGVLRTPISETMEANFTVSEGDSGWAAVSKDLPEGWHVSRGFQYDGDRLLAVAEKYGWTATEAEHVPDWLMVWEAKYSADDMKSMVSKGQAMKNAKGDPSYPIADVSDLKKAIHAVGRGGADHDAVRSHIIKRAKALGQSDLIPDNWNSDGTMKETEVRLGDVTEYYPDGPSNVSGFCIDAYSGPLSVTIRGCVSPDQLRAAAQAAACAAMDAINCMDPDDDADIDAGADGMQMETKSGAVSPDDDMTDRQAESVINIEVEGSLLNESELRALVQRHMEELGRMHEAHANEKLAERLAKLRASGLTYSEMREAILGVDAEAPAEAEGATETTSSPEKAETVEDTNKEESAMGDTQEVAAEAAPQSSLTAEDMKLLGETIGNTMAEALKAFAEMNAPKHAAAPQETTEKEEAVTESAPVAATPKVDEIAALKESLASELRREIRDELRAEILEEKGLPPRRGYRLTENDEPEQMTDAELFDKHRVDILLAGYAATPSPDATQVA